MPTVAEQIKFMRGWEIFVTADSVNMLHEFNNYQYRQDRITGEWYEEPDKDAGFDHAMDAMRYAVFTQYGSIPGRGGRSQTVKMW